MKSELTNSQIAPLISIPVDFVGLCNQLCGRISKLEWSGVLFYEILNQESGDLDDLIFAVKDIYPLDIGTPGTTSYEEKNDEAYLDYLMSIPDTWQRGTIHSHNTMSVFFSDIDLNDLGVYCNGFNMYLSLIVNNKLEFDARITHKCHVENKITDSLGKVFTETKDLFYVYDPYIEITYPTRDSINPLIDELYKIYEARPKPKSAYRQQEVSKPSTNNTKGDLYYQQVVDDFATEWLELDEVKRTLTTTNDLSKRHFQLAIDDLDQGLFNDVYAAISDIGDEKDESIFFNLFTSK